MAGREAGSPGELIAGHTDQAKSQWAAGEAAAVVAFQSTVPPQQGPDLPLVSQPCVWCVFCQRLSGTRKDRACQNQGSVFNIIMTAVKTVIITQNQREERRTSVGQVWGEETNPIFLSTITWGYRNPLISTLEAQPAETWGPNQGSLDARSWVWGGGVTLESGSVPQVQSLGIVWVSPLPRGSHICSLPAVCPSGVPNV